MNILYLDCQAGISGDMTVAALLDLGVPLQHLEKELALLPLPAGSYKLSTSGQARQGVTALKFDVAIQETHHHRKYSDIKKLITDSTLPATTIELAMRIFLRLAEAEAKVHGVSLSDVHFHEVGAVDSIVDIASAAICLDYLKIDKIYISSLPLCSGFVQTDHGLMPLPAPATAELMQGFAVHPASGSGERVTPTGAAIVAALAERSPLPQGMMIEKTGSGAGGKDFHDIPNLLRAFLGRIESAAADADMFVIETNIDDSTPEVLGYAVEKLLLDGANDVWLTPIMMKKCRPATMLSVICTRDDLKRLSDSIFAETSAIGVRSYPVSRIVLERRIEERNTVFGMVRFKVTASGAKPEFEDCRRIAIEQGIALREVQKVLGDGVK